MVLKSFQEFISGYPDGDTESAKGMYASYLRDEQSFMQHEEFGSFDELNAYLASVSADRHDIISARALWDEWNRADDEPMTALRLIKILQGFVDKHGDLPVKATLDFDCEPDPVFTVGAYDAHGGYGGPAVEIIIH